MSTCATQCVGGQPRVCREVELLGNNRDTNSEICTCVCPPNIFSSCFDLSAVRSLLGGLVGLKLLKLKLLPWFHVGKKLLKYYFILFKFKFIVYYVLKCFIIFLGLTLGVLKFGGDFVEREMWGWVGDEGYLK